MNVSRVTVVNLAVGILLLASPFLVAISSSGIWPYDPWWDVNADGVIDIGDVARVSGAFGTFGDSTKNVTIAGRVNKLAYILGWQSVAAHTAFESPWILVDGYSKVTVCLYTSTPTNFYSLRTYHEAVGMYFIVDSVSDVPTDFVKTYDVPNKWIKIYYINNSPNTEYIEVNVYLIP